MTPRIILFIAFISAMSSSALSQGLWFGDLNEDGIIDSADLEGVRSLLNSEQDVTGRQALFGDANADGSVTPLDLIYLLDILEDREEPIPVMTSITGGSATFLNVVPVEELSNEVNAQSDDVTFVKIEVELISENNTVSDDATFIRILPPETYIEESNTTATTSPTFDRELP